MVDEIKLLAASGCDAGKNWDEDENFNGFPGFGNRSHAGEPRMSMEHIVNKVWKHKMLRLGRKPID
jgi:hypothetical protein